MAYNDTIEKTVGKTAKGLLLKIGAGAILAAAPTMIAGCNPINVCKDAYKTAEIRREEPGLYRFYKNIDMNNLTPAEKSYLNQMHQEYGNSPVDPKKMNIMDEEMLSNILLLTGKKKVSDKEWIFLYRIADELAGAAMGNMYHN